MNNLCETRVFPETPKPGFERMWQVCMCWCGIGPTFLLAQTHSITNLPLVSPNTYSSQQRYTDNTLNTW